ncbi:NAD(P)-dependent oxidoreductase [Hazenella sp. IB182353]|uniref:NAD-dependent epimerase/dehydratase family protein n=1 Tax=Polycladospora coralii TaxID=2771432 RepID=UPI00174614FA|nr:NAD(P)-dependent oxidoreductase [Polycladospora coralii]MBS7530415.1 NAD(P)-dependent oxidoreductase [Polycladospora coralii]
MKVLITGATGFLGQKLALRLHREGLQVTGTARNKEIGKALIAKGIHFEPASLHDTDKIIALCQNQDMVVHCGALSSPWGTYRQFYESNVIGTHNVIKGCQQHGVKRLIHVSTPSIYFRYQDQFKIKEIDPLPAKKVNHYAETKWQAEQAIDQAHTDGFPVITIRPRALFGPGDQAIFPRLLTANEKGMVPLINRGQAVIDITHVENVVDALILCMYAPPHLLGEKYNITNGEPMKLINILERVFTLLDQPFQGRSFSFLPAYTIAACMEVLAKSLQKNKEPLLTRYTVGVLGKSQTLDISKAQNELGYQPRISIQEGLADFIRWWNIQ